MYIKSDYKFDAASEAKEDTLTNFEQSWRVEQAASQQRTTIIPNLTPRQWSIVTLLRKHDQYIVIPSDKGLGPCIIEREFYTRRAISEHLGNERNYRSISATAALNIQRLLHYRFRTFLLRFYHKPKSDPNDDTIPIPEAIVIFLQRSLKKNPTKLARFRMTIKIHKNPFKFRPIVSCAGTAMNDLSKVVDYYLRMLLPNIKSYLRDGQQLIDDLKTIRVPPNARLVTSDANSMYNNIDTPHAIQVISWWLDELEPDLPPGYPIEAVKYAM